MDGIEAEAGGGMAMDMGVVVEVDAEVEEVVADAGLRPRFLTCCSGAFSGLTSVVLGSSSRFLLADLTSFSSLPTWTSARVATSVEEEAGEGPLFTRAGLPLLGAESDLLVLLVAGAPSVLAPRAVFLPTRFSKP